MPVDLQVIDATILCMAVQHNRYQLRSDLRPDNCDDGISKPHSAVVQRHHDHRVDCCRRRRGGHADTYDWRSGCVVGLHVCVRGAGDHGPGALYFCASALACVVRLCVAVLVCVCGMVVCHGTRAGCVSGVRFCDLVLRCDGMSFGFVLSPHATTRPTPVLHTPYA